MTSDGAEIWHAYTRGVKPGARRRVKKAAATLCRDEKRTDKKAARLAAETVPLKPIAAKAAPLTSVTLERKREKALRGGEVEIDARIDLHGMTQGKAFDALGKFMHRAVATGHRHLLIITGKGGAGGGVLKRSVPDWLAHYPDAARILAVRPASLRHGGEGAFYVILRAKRS